MGTVIYPLGESGLHFTGAGGFSTTIGEEDTVVGVDDSNLDAFERLYAGVIIRNRGAAQSSPNALRLLSGEDELELPSQIRLGLELIEIWEIGFEAAHKLNEWITKHGPRSDPLMSALQNLHEELKSIGDFQLAAWVSQREDNLALLLAHSSSAIITLDAFLSSGESSDDPQWASRLALAERDSLIAAQAFTHGMEHGFWKRPYSTRAVQQPTQGWNYGDPIRWMSLVPDRAEQDEFGRVWDYRWALPVMLYAVSCRVAVIRGLGRLTRAEKREIRQYLRVISAVFAKMSSGVRVVRVPTDNEVALTWSRSRGVPVVAVDIYGGRGYSREFINFSRNEFHGAPVPPRGTWFEDSYTDVARARRNVDAISRFWHGVTCLELGLPELLAYASVLQEILDEPAVFPLSLGAKVSQYARLGTAESTAAIRFVTDVVELDEGIDEPVPPEKLLGMFRGVETAQFQKTRLHDLISALEEAGAEVERSPKP